MNDQPCTTCGNPIGMTLKESLARMNRVMPFVTQHEALKAKLLKWENDLKQRSIQIEETASRITTQAAELQNEREKLAQDEQALEELLTAASIPAQKFESLRSENQELQLQTKSAEQEHHKAFTKASKTNEMLLLKLKDEKQKQMESDKDRTLSRRELLAATSENKKQNRQIDQLNRKLVSLQVKYDRECEQRKQRKETKKAGSVSRTEVLKLQQELDDLTREHTMLQTRYAREARLLEAEREKNRHVEPSPRKKPAANDEISKKLASLRTKNKELLSEIDALKEQVTEISEKNGQAGVYTSFAIGDLDLLNSLSQEVSELFSPPSDIVTLGSGPFPESDFDDYLRTLDITPRADGCSWIIIGREDWSEEQLNALIDASDLDEVKVFSQELFVAGILTTHDPFSLPLEILKKFAEGHPALEYLINSGFEWPEIIVEEDFGEPVYIRGAYERVDESPLYRMGYQVGVTHGLSQPKRRSLLKSAYHGAIPDVEDDDYMEEWGRPRQSKRLWRIAHHIAWLIRSRKPIPSMRFAVRDWTSDLDFLEEEFYTNRMRFKWPLG